MEIKPCVKCGNPIFKKNKACPKCRKTYLVWLEDLECYTKRSPYKTTTVKKKIYATPESNAISGIIAIPLIIFAIAVCLWFFIYYNN